jgi:hypothetical protein
MKKYKQQDISSGVIKCVTCEEIKSLDNFYLYRGYYNYTCKGCYKEKHKKNYTKVEKAVKVFSFIVCNKCGVEKPVGNYLKTPNGYYIKKCKECRCVKSTKIRPQRNDGYKTCGKCKLDLLTTEFYKSNGRPKGPCKKCRKEINRVFQRKWLDTKEGRLKSRESSKRYTSKLKELRKPIIEEKKRLKELLLVEKENRRLERERKRERKKEEILIKRLEYNKLKEYWKTDEWKVIKKQKDSEKHYANWKRKWETDELFSTKVRIRNLVRNTFRKSGYSKPSEGTEKILGCSFDELKSHLESKFVDGMNWENRGEWHIDHIIPLSSANTKEELIGLSHYSNLQPLWAEDNMKKGDKIF